MAALFLHGLIEGPIGCVNIQYKEVVWWQGVGGGSTGAGERPCPSRGDERVWAFEECDLGHRYWVSSRVVHAPPLPHTGKPFNNWLGETLPWPLIQTVLKTSLRARLRINARGRRAAFPTQSASASAGVVDGRWASVRGVGGCVQQHRSIPDASEMNLHLGLQIKDGFYTRNSCECCMVML